MKYKAIIASLFMVIGLLSCNSKKQLNESIFISGFDKSTANEILFIFESDHLNNIDSHKPLDTCLVDSLGNYSFSFKATEPSFYTIKNSNNRNTYYKKYLYLNRGDTLIIEKDEDKIIMNGNASKINQIQWTIPKLIMKDTFIAEMFKDRNIWKLEPNDFEDFLDTLKNKKLFYLDSLKNEVTIPKLYHDFFIEQINYSSINEYWSYLKYHNYYAHDKWEYLSKDSIKNDFFSLSLMDTTYHFIEDYHECINGFVNDLNHEKTKDLPDSIKWDSEYQNKFKIIKNKLKGKNRDIGINSLTDNFWLYLMGKNDFYKQTDEVLNYLKNNNSSDFYFNKFSKQYNEYLNIAPGNSAPNFIFPDTSNTLVSLNDFKGKVVYIDFWGTWCGPCIASIPKHLELQKKLKNQKDVVFLYVALEYDKENINGWKKFLKNKDFPGVHLVAEKQFGNEQLKPYKLRAAPTYMLIDKNGDIAITSADGPDKIYDALIKLLGE